MFPSCSNRTITGRKGTAVLESALKPELFVREHALLQVLASLPNLILLTRNYKKTCSHRHQLMPDSYLHHAQGPGINGCCCDSYPLACTCIHIHFLHPVLNIPLWLCGSIIIHIFIYIQRTVMRNDEILFVLQRSSASRCSSAIDDAIKSISMMISPSGITETS